MKLLFDQNLSYKLVQKLSLEFPESNHVKLLGLQESDDLAIWHLAKDRDYTIVTKDADFYELGLVFGFPPRIIWIRTGNHATSFIENLILSHKHEIQALADSDKICLEIF